MAKKRSGKGSSLGDGHVSGETYDHVLVISSLLSSALNGLVHDGTVLHNARLEDLSHAFLERHDPDCVLSPLVGRDCDILEVAARLSYLGFTGLLLAVTEPLPNPDYVKAEVRSAYPAIRFDLIEIPQDGAQG